MKYLTKDEIEKLLVRIDNKRDKVLIQLGLVLGCRVSEIVSLRLKSITPDQVTLWDEKKNVHRECVIDETTRALLEDYLKDGWEPEPHVPHQLFYFTYKTANRILKHWCAQVGIPKEKAHWHTLRHTYVVQSLDAGVPLNHVCEQTGDSPMTVIRIYGKPSIDSRRKMIESKGAYWRREDEKPDVKVRAKTYKRSKEIKKRDRPSEVKARTKTYNKLRYHQRPEVKARVKAHLKKQRQLMLRGEYPEGPIQKKCLECGLDFGAKSPRAKYCPDCRAVKHQIYYAIRNIRGTVGRRAIAYPSEAQAIIENMQALEGQKFVEFALDGIPTRLRNANNGGQSSGD